MGIVSGPDRRPVAVVVTADGRRVQVPLPDDRLAGGVVDLLLSLIAGLAGLLALITGSRRENGGTRRDERR